MNKDVTHVNYKIQIENKSWASDNLIANKAYYF